MRFGRLGDHQAPSTLRRALNPGPVVGLAVRTGARWDHNQTIRLRPGRFEDVGEGSPQAVWSRRLEDRMSSTRVVLFIHSAPAALCPHIEWAIAGVLGAPTRLDWIPQPIERSAYRTDYSWTGSVGTGARLASALTGWQKLRYEVTEDATGSARASDTPTHRRWASSTPSPASTATSWCPRIGYGTPCSPPTRVAATSTPHWTSCSARSGTTN